jgi:MFS transporter, MHS family, citrate/tricarballylate:H+ symporter
MAKRYSYQNALEPNSRALSGRATLGVTIGNMLEFYDFVTYSFFALQIWPHILPFA